MTPRLYLLCIAVQFMAALVWRDCGPGEVVGAVLLVVALSVVYVAACQVGWYLSGSRQESVSK